MQTLKNIGFSAVLTASVIVLSGCNTISGLGEDLQAAGRAIEESVENKTEDQED